MNHGLETCLQYQETEPPSGCFSSNSKVVRGHKSVCVRPHCFVLSAEHRHRHCGHQNWTLAVIQLSPTTREQSAMEEEQEEEEEERIREEQRCVAPCMPCESSCFVTFNTCFVLKSCSRHSRCLPRGASSSSLIHAHYLPLNMCSRSPPLIRG